MLCSRLEPLAVIHQNDGSIYAPLFDDILFSADGGPEEVQHVFLAGNDLPTRFATSRSFVIGELGFGSGLNFLSTWQLIEQSAPAGSELDYVAIEKHPIPCPVLVDLHNKWPQLGALAGQLRAQYPPLVPGIHRRTFAEGRLRLTLCYGDVADILAELEFAADAWFLDGFAPSRNPDMWSSEVCQHIARLTRIDGTFSTYSAAGFVRRNLTTAGFDVTRCHGFNRKRHMLRGKMARYSTRNALEPQPWYLPRSAANHDRSALVIGAGLAGCAAARSLAERGWSVQVLDHLGIARGASGTAVAICEPLIESPDDPAHQFSTSAFCFAHNHISLFRTACSDQIGFIPSGVLHLMQTPISDDHPFAVLCQTIDASKVRAVSGMARLNQPGTHVQGSVIDPRLLCSTLLNHPRVSVDTKRSVDDLQFDAAESVWIVHTTNGDAYQARVVVVATAYAAGLFAPLSFLPLQPARGQITRVPATAESRDLRLPVSRNGVWITPVDVDGMHSLGATFDRGDVDTAIRATDHQRNIASLCEALPEIAHALDLRGKAIDPDVLSGWAGVRATLPDRLPAVGPVPDEGAFRCDFADLHHGRPGQQRTSASYMPGLYCSIGHGARGVNSTLLAAEMLASEICGTPTCIARSLREAVHPARFLIRELRKSPQHRHGT